MSIQWYYTQDSPTVLGPVTGRQLRELVSTGQLLPTHRVRKEGMTKTVSARRVKGLFTPREPHTA